MTPPRSRAPLAEQIRECERDLAVYRKDLERAMSDSRRAVRERMAAPSTLAAGAIAGFIAGRLVGAPRGRADGEAPRTGAAAKGAGWVGLASGLVAAVVRGQLATPGSWLNRRITGAFAKAGPDRPGVPSQKTL